MIGWYIGDIVVLVAVVPVVVFFLNRLIRPVREIKTYVDDVLENGVALTATMDEIPKLVETQALTAVALEQVSRYGAEIARILNSSS
ncbi:MAG: hypothetical protein ACRDY2_00725 [Acidimicrobiales bacterium]